MNGSTQQKENTYEEWAKNKVANAMRRFDENGSDGVSEEVIQERIFSKLKRADTKEINNNMNRIFFYAKAAKILAALSLIFFFITAILLVILWFK